MMLYITSLRSGEVGLSADAGSEDPDVVLDAGGLGRTLMVLEGTSEKEIIDDRGSVMVRQIIPVPGYRLTVGGNGPVRVVNVPEALVLLNALRHACHRMARPEARHAV